MSDRNGASSGFDPRFNPAFQPGYDPAVHGAPQQPTGGSSPSVAERADAAAPAFVVGPPPVTEKSTGERPTAEQFFAEQFAGAHPDEARVVEAPASQAPAAQTPAAERLAAEAEPVTALSRVNPLVIALWVLSLLFIGVGIYGLRFIDERVTQLSTAGGFGNADYYLLQAYATGAPMLIVLGLATATGTLFFYASRWRGRAKPSA